VGGSGLSSLPGTTTLASPSISPASEARIEILLTARKAGLGKVGAQVLRRSAATLRAYAGVPKHVAAKEMGHTASVFERSYAKVYEDAQDMEETRTRLASIGWRATKLTKR
jgi:integrase